MNGSMLTKERDNQVDILILDQFRLKIVGQLLSP